MTPWLSNLVRFCKHNDDAKRQRVTAILDKLITMTINEKQMYPSIQAKIWGSLGQVLSFLKYLSSTSLVQIFIWYPHCAKHCARDIAIEKTVPFFKKHARHHLIPDPLQNYRSLCLRTREKLIILALFSIALLQSPHRALDVQNPQVLRANCTMPFLKWRTLISAGGPRTNLRGHQGMAACRI